MTPRPVPTEHEITFILSELRKILNSDIEVRQQRHSYRDVTVINAFVKDLFTHFA